MKDRKKKVSMREFFAILVVVVKFIKDVLFPFYRANIEEVKKLIADFSSLVNEIKDSLDGDDENEDDAI